MWQTIKDIGIWVGIFVALVHNVLLTVSLMPANPLSIRYANEALSYINHLSPQGWFFFTPVPTKSYMLTFREPNEPTWQNPFLFSIIEHRRNPLGLFEKVAYIHMELSKDLAIFYDQALENDEQDIAAALAKDPLYERVQNFLAFYDDTSLSLEWRFIEYEVPPFSLRKQNSELYEKILFEGRVER